MRKFILIAVAFLLAATFVQAVNLRREHDFHLSSNRGGIYHVPLERKDAPADAKIKLIQLLSDHHDNLKQSRITPDGVFVQRRKFSTNIHEIKLGNMQNAQVKLPLFT
jgi:hypothetical protein